MTAYGLTDAEITAALRARGVPEGRIDDWLRSTKRVASGMGIEPGALRRHALGLPPDRGRTGHKRASTPRRSEASVQREIVMALKAAGFYVRRIGQRNAKGTQDPGVPDIWAMNAGRAAWIECKAPHGRQSQDQRDFQYECQAAGVRYILAKSVDDVKELL